LVVGFVLKLPVKLAGSAVEAAEAGLVFDAVEQVELAVLDRPSAVALAGAHVPDDAKALLRPAGENALLRRDAGARRTQEGRPVDAGPPLGLFSRGTADQRHQATQNNRSHGRLSSQLMRKENASTR